MEPVSSRKLNLERQFESLVTELSRAITGLSTEIAWTHISGEEFNAEFIPQLRARDQQIGALFPEVNLKGFTPVALTLRFEAGGHSFEIAQIEMESNTRYGEWFETRKHILGKDGVLFSVEGNDRVDALFSTLLNELMVQEMKNLTGMALHVLGIRNNVEEIHGRIATKASPH